MWAAQVGGLSLGLRRCKAQPALMPAAFLDRSKIIRLESPSIDHLAAAGTRLLRDRLPDHQHDLGNELLNEGVRRLEKNHARVSLRQIERMVESLVEGLSSPMLM
ncbi:hypothetical protein [Pacificibacter marinus]|uniref:hypothetical protein n=1 Tax=Pacificibacter marinus TaxID=658057 RepID=UPI001C075453|nr:hypothetical protein [Pacificibacter marinus]MBU2868458.1 hypothetical protein [Pacificibacter marinus]